MIGMVAASPPAGSRVEPRDHAPLHEWWWFGFDTGSDSVGRASAHGATPPPTTTRPPVAVWEVGQDVVRACVGDEGSPRCWRHL